MGKKNNFGNALNNNIDGSIVNSLDVPKKIGIFNNFNNFDDLRNLKECIKNYINSNNENDLKRFKKKAYAFLLNDIEFNTAICKGCENYYREVISNINDNQLYLGLMTDITKKQIKKVRIAELQKAIKFCKNKRLKDCIGSLIKYYYYLSKSQISFCCSAEVDLLVMLTETFYKNYVASNKLIKKNKVFGKCSLIVFNELLFKINLVVSFNGTDFKKFYSFPEKKYSNIISSNVKIVKFNQALIKAVNSYKLSEKYEEFNYFFLFNLLKLAMMGDMFKDYKFVAFLKKPIERLASAARNFKTQRPKAFRNIDFVRFAQEVGVRIKAIKLLHYIFLYLRLFVAGTVNDYATFKLAIEEKDNLLVKYFIALNRLNLHKSNNFLTKTALNHKNNKVLKMLMENKNYDISTEDYYLAKKIFDEEFWREGDLSKERELKTIIISNSNLDVDILEYCYLKVISKDYYIAERICKIVLVKELKSFLDRQIKFALNKFTAYAVENKLEAMMCMLVTRPNYSVLRDENLKNMLEYCLKNKGSALEIIKLLIEEKVNFVDNNYLKIAKVIFEFAIKHENSEILMHALNVGKMGIEFLAELVLCLNAKYSNKFLKVYKTILELFQLDRTMLEEIIFESLNKNRILLLAYAIKSFKKIFGKSFTGFIKATDYNNHLTQAIKSNNVVLVSMLLKDKKAEYETELISQATDWAMEKDSKVIINLLENNYQISKNIKMNNKKLLELFRKNKVNTLTLLFANNLIKLTDMFGENLNNYSLLNAIKCKAVVNLFTTAFLEELSEDVLRSCINHLNSRKRRKEKMRTNLLHKFKERLKKLEEYKYEAIKILTFFIDNIEKIEELMKDKKHKFTIDSLFAIHSSKDLNQDNAGNLSVNLSLQKILSLLSDINNLDLIRVILKFVCVALSCKDKLLKYIDNALSIDKVWNKVHIKIHGTNNYLIMLAYKYEHEELVEKLITNSRVKSCLKSLDKYSEVYQKYCPNKSNLGIPLHQTSKDTTEVKQENLIKQVEENKNEERSGKKKKRRKKKRKRNSKVKISSGLNLNSDDKADKSVKEKITAKFNNGGIKKSKTPRPKKVTKDDMFEVNKQYYSPQTPRKFNCNQHDGNVYSDSYQIQNNFTQNAYFTPNYLSQKYTQNFNYTSNYYPGIIFIGYPRAKRANFEMWQDYNPHFSGSGFYPNEHYCKPVKIEKKSIEVEKKLIKAEQKLIKVKKKPISVEQKSIKVDKPNLSELKPTSSKKQHDELNKQDVSDNFYQNLVYSCKQRFEHENYLRNKYEVKDLSLIICIQKLQNKELQKEKSDSSLFHLFKPSRFEDPFFANIDKPGESIFFSEPTTWSTKKSLEEGIQNKKRREEPNLKFNI